MRLAILIAAGLALFAFGSIAGHTVSASRASHVNQVIPFELMKNAKDLPIQVVEPAF